MKTTITKKLSDIVKTLIVLFILWSILSLIYSPIILPSPYKTLVATWNVLKDSEFHTHVLTTLKRLLIGLFGGVSIGSIIGIAIGRHERINNLFEPIFHIIQATPPISWLALGMIWFGLDGEATIFIVFIASLPILIINIVEGLKNIDYKLIQMANLFHLDKNDILFNIIIPSLKPYFKSGFTIAVGLGWKLVIMGEVLSSSTGIGSQITNARLNIETEKVLAWTIVIIILGVLSQKIIDFIFDYRSRGKDNYGFTNEQNREKLWGNYSIKRFFPKSQ
jgi:NitT/TauT family transport system permease protein